MSKQSQPAHAQERTSGLRGNASLAALLALALSLGLAWANFQGTTRWAEVAGALHGWKAPWYLAALSLTTLRQAGQVHQYLILAPL